MEVRYYIDPETGQPHIYKHGVMEEEVEDVLREWQQRDRGAEQTQVCVGRTSSGRPLKVIVRRLTPLFVITAYELEGNQLRAFRRRLRRRGR